MTIIDDVQACLDSGTIFKLGMSGPQILTLQAALLQMGFSCRGLDGKFGQNTYAAVLAFQKAYNIGETGELGPETIGKMLETLKKTQTKTTSGMTKSLMVKAADFASTECDKGLVWTDMDCEAEKYLAPLRYVVGQRTGRFSWCACFVTWCVRQAGGDIPNVLPNTNSGTVAYVPSWEAWARDQGIWNDVSDNSFLPQKGDIVLFDWDGTDTPEDDDHIGIVYSYEPGSQFVSTCEGNTSSDSHPEGNTTAHKMRNFSVCHGFIRFLT